jgi:hypothetical protein
MNARPLATDVGIEVLRSPRDYAAVKRALPRECLRLDPRAVSRVGCPAVFRRAAAAGDTGVGRRLREIAMEPSFITAALAGAPPSLRDRCGFIEGTFAETDDNGARRP